MIRVILRVMAWFKAWRRYCTLLSLLFMARGIVLMCILPPFEGWDEHQHLAYVVYLIEKGRAPELAENPMVPRSLYPSLVAVPHCPLSQKQLASLGAKTYDEFWKANSPPILQSDAPDIRLYQAQHPSLYYRLMVPIVRAFHPDGDVRSMIGALRLVNVVFGAASVFIVTMLLGRLLVESRLRYLIGLLIALQPLYLVNCTRAASDALGVVLGTAAIGLILVTVRKRWRTGGFLAGAATGLAILAKTVNLGLAPFGVMAMAIFGWSDRIGARRTTAGIGMFLLGLFLVAGPYGYSNFKTYGVITPMQESVLNRDKDNAIPDLVPTIRGIDWRDELNRRYLRRSLWTGGWSYLSPPRPLLRAHEIVIVVALLGFVFTASPMIRSQRSLFIHRGSAGAIVALCSLMAAGLCYHMAQTQMHLGSIATNIWYAAVTFPWLLCLFAQGAAYWPGRSLAGMAACALGVIYLVTEVYGTIFVMVDVYTGGASGGLARQRIAEMHPVWLSPVVGMVALIVSTLLLCIAVGTSFAHEGESNQRKAPLIEPR